MTKRERNLSIAEMVSEMDDRMNAVNRIFTKAVRTGLSSVRQDSIRTLAAEISSARKSLTAASRRSDVQKVYQTVMDGLEMIIASLD